MKRTGQNPVAIAIEVAVTAAITVAVENAPQVDQRSEKRREGDKGGMTRPCVPHRGRRQIAVRGEVYLGDCPLSARRNGRPFLRNMYMRSSMMGPSNLYFCFILILVLIVIPFPRLKTTSSTERDHLLQSLYSWELCRETFSLERS
jgi:hypothetical protein